MEKKNKLTLTEEELAQIKIEEEKEQRKNQIIDYFRSYKPKFPSIKDNKFKVGLLALFGGAVFLIYIAYFEITFLGVLIGSLIVAFAIFMLFRWLEPYINMRRMYSGRPDDELIDDWLFEDIKKNIQPQAAKILSINFSRVNPENYIFIPYPIYWKHPLVENDKLQRQKKIIKTPEGSVEMYMYAVWNVQLLILSENYISFYSCIYNWAANEILHHKTNEFFFNDITSIKDDQIDMQKNIYNPDLSDDENPEPVGICNLFKITNFSGETIDIINNIPSLKAGSQITPEFQRIIQALRITLRNKRFNETIDDEINNNTPLLDNDDL